MALPFSYILQSQFCPWEYRSAVTQIFIYLFVCLFLCKYIARGDALQTSPFAA